MKSNAECIRFQEKVNELLIRHRSILDVLSKFQESNGRVNRAVVKTVTNCGCLKISARRQPFPANIGLDEMGNYSNTHISGKLCESCREVVAGELGNNLFYLAALCNLLELDLATILEMEYDKVSALGKFNLS